MSKKVAHNCKNKWRSDDVKFEESIDFSSLLLPQPILKGLKKAGFLKPSPVQTKAIPIARCGFDLIVQAKSGTGKTCVFSVIALDTVYCEDINANLQVLVLSPTREIAEQSCSVIKTIGKYIPNFECYSFIGGTSVSEDIEKLNCCQIAVGTPGRIKHLITAKALLTGCIRLFVLDEADKLMERGFFEEIEWIYNRLPLRKQMLALSATYTPDLISSLKKFMAMPNILTVSGDELALKGLVQFYHLIPHSNMSNVIVDNKQNQLYKILNEVSFSQCLIFCNSIMRVEAVYELLKEENFPIAKISSNDDQESRQNTIQQLKQFDSRILVTSDLIARGVDVENVDLVINLDLCANVETYLHRIGRAGRFGSKAVAITFITGGKDELRLGEFEKLGGFEVYPLPVPLPESLISMPLEIICSLPVGSYKKSLHELKSGFADDLKKICVTDSGLDVLNEANNCCKLKEECSEDTSCPEKVHSEIKETDLTDDSEVEKLKDVLTITTISDTSANDNNNSVHANPFPENSLDQNSHLEMKPIDEEGICLDRLEKTTLSPDDDVAAVDLIVENDANNLNYEEDVTENAEACIETNLNQLQSNDELLHDVQTQIFNKLFEESIPELIEVDPPLILKNVSDVSAVKETNGKIHPELTKDESDVKFTESITDQLVHESCGDIRDDSKEELPSILPESTLTAVEEAIKDSNELDNLQTLTENEVSVCLENKQRLPLSQQLEEFFLSCNENRREGCNTDCPSKDAISEILGNPGGSSVKNCEFWEKHFEKTIQNLKAGSAGDDSLANEYSHPQKELTPANVTSIQNYLQDTKKTYFANIGTLLKEVGVEKKSEALTQKAANASSLIGASRSKKKANRRNKRGNQEAENEQIPTIVEDHTTHKVINEVKQDNLSPQVNAELNCELAPEKEDHFTENQKEPAFNDNIQNSNPLVNSKPLFEEDNSGLNPSVEDDSQKDSEVDEINQEVLPSNKMKHISTSEKQEDEEKRQNRASSKNCSSGQKSAMHPKNIQKLKMGKSTDDNKHRSICHSFHEHGPGKSTNTCQESVAAGICCHSSNSNDMYSNPLKCCFGKQCNLHAKGEVLHGQLLDFLKSKKK